MTRRCMILSIVEIHNMSPSTVSWSTWILIAALAPLPGECGWVNLSPESSYYMPYTWPAIITYTWHDAGPLCRGLRPGSDWAPLRHYDDLTYIRHVDYTSSYPYWVGIDRLSSEEWRYTVSGDALGSDLSLWDTEHGYPKDEHIHRCAYISDASKGRLRNDQCSRKMAYICQRLRDYEEITTLNPPLTTPPSPPTGVCPEGYTGVGWKCYAIFPDHARSWEEALRACAASGHLLGSLASFRDLQEFAEVQALLKVGNGNGRANRLWIGLYSDPERTSTPLEWYWADNSAVGYTQLIPMSQPGCAYLGTESPGHWFSRDCQEAQGYVCQAYRDASVTAMPPPSPCPDGFHLYDNACYKLESQPLTWDQAEVACEGNSSHLVSVHSFYENAAMIAYLSTEARSAWIGFRRDEESLEFTWSDDSDVTFTRWGGSQSATCTEISDEGVWTTSDCQEARASLCKIPLGPLPTAPPPRVGTCPRSFDAEWVQKGHYCYQFRRPTGSSTFAEALRQCSLEHPGASLASIHHTSENTYIHLQGINNNNHDIWIGFRQLHGEGVVPTWSWTDGQPAQYINWYHGEPSASGDCAVLSIDKLHAKQWVVQDCRQNNQFVCKVPLGPALVLPPDGPGSCPNDTDWHPMGSFCYLFRPDELLSWQQARTRCLDYGADLATIADVMENTYVSEQAFSAQKLPFEKSFWIGLRRPDPGAPFYWVDSLEEPKTTFWDDEASVTDREMSVARVNTRTGLWFTDVEHTHNGYVCQTRKASSNKPTNEAPVDKNGGLHGAEVVWIAIIGVIVALAVVLALAVKFAGPKIRELYTHSTGAERLA